MIKVVYFNQWFSSITDVIKDIKDKHGDKIRVIASSKNASHAYKDVVDKFIVEDWVESENEAVSEGNYIAWLTDFFAENKVDIFFAKKHSDWIAKHKYEFSLQQVFIVTEDLKTQMALESKVGVYDELSKVPGIRNYIPEYFLGDREKVKQLLKNYSKASKAWCFKLAKDEGGFSFRRIERHKLTFDTLKGYRVNCVSASETKDLMEKSSDEQLQQLLFMEYLDNPEISVDCYNSKKGFIAICREKESGTRNQKLYYSRTISKLCEEIGEHFKIRFPFNVQFRYDKDKKLKLLEINPRMSGGTYYQTLFGMNLADVCLCDLLNDDKGYNIDDYTDFETKRVSHVEKAIKVE